MNDRPPPLDPTEVLPAVTPRALRRAMVDWFAAFQSGDTFGVGRVREIGERGAIVVCDQPLAKGTETTLKISAPELSDDHAFILKGRVVHQTEPTGEGTWPAAMEVDLIDLPDHHRKKIADFVAASGVTTAALSRREVKQMLGSAPAERFDVLARLGAGGTAEVYKAYDRELEEIVALKVLKPEVMSDPQVRARLRREIRLNRKIKNPHVAAIFDLDRFGDRDCLIMELVNGITLERQLRERGPLAEPDALRYSADVLGGLALAHDLGIVHRDLKPSNMMITPEERLVLLDFGIARRSKDPGITQAASIVGTPSYMSPEQIEERELTPASDVYSFGCVLFAMLSGRPPFHSKQGGVATAVQHLQKQAPRLSAVVPGVSPGLDRIVQHCLQKEPKDRYHDAHALAADLADLSAPVRVSEPVHAPRVLVIEDEDTVRRLMCDALETEGYQTETATDGLDGLARAFRDPPDLICLDLRMPKMDGFDAVLALRGQARTRDVPILVVTAVPKEERDLLATMGVNDVVQKPFQLRPFLDRVRAMMS